MASLGLSPYDSSGDQQFRGMMVNSLARLGAQLRQDITQIQTNRQLKGMAGEIQGMNPTSPDFPAQFGQLLSNYPLAASSPAGKTALGMLGSAYKETIDNEIRAANPYGVIPGTTSLYRKDTGEIMQSGITPTSTVNTAMNTGARIYTADQSAQLKRDALDFQKEYRTLDRQSRESEGAATRENRLQVAGMRGGTDPSAKAIQQGYAQTLKDYNAANATYIAGEKNVQALEAAGDREGAAALAVEVAKARRQKEGLEVVLQSMKSDLERLSKPTTALPSMGARFQQMPDGLPVPDEGVIPGIAAPSVAPEALVPVQPPMPQTRQFSYDPKTRTWK